MRSPKSVSQSRQCSILEESESFVEIEQRVGRTHACTELPVAAGRAFLNISAGDSSSGIPQILREVVFAPRVHRAHALSSPPFIHIFVVLRRTVVVQHGAHPAPEVCIDKLAGAFPAKVRVVQFVVVIQSVQILGELLR